jgi:3-methyladenine DNA glycosylase AlkD
MRRDEGDRARGWAQDAVRAAEQALRPAADAGRAVPMAAYMRARFPFLGIPAPVRRDLLRTAWAALPAPTAGELADAVRGLWQMPEREFQYAGCDLLGRWLGTERRAAGFDPDYLVSVVQPLLVTRAWWDSVDALRPVAVGPLVQAHPALVAVVRRWVDDEDRWLVRSAVIHQLGYGDRTDEELLFELCASRAADREFFVAKGIGWALRTHARRCPEQVTAFCDRHPELTPLARREALKHLAV